MTLILGKPGAGKTILAEQIAVERLGIQRLVIDSVATVEVAILEPNRAPGYFASLINDLREHDVTSVMTQESSAFDDGMGETLGAALADNLIRLRLAEYGSHPYRILSILKMRQSGFDPGLREFRIAEDAVRVLPVEESGIGILTGIAAQEGRVSRAKRHDRGI